MTTTFDTTITLTPSSLAGTVLLDRPQEAVDAVRRAVEARPGAAWIDVEWQNIRGEWPLVDRMVVHADDGEGHAEALKVVVEMVAKRAIEVCAARSASGGRSSSPYRPRLRDQAGR